MRPRHLAVVLFLFACDNRVNRESDPIGPPAIVCGTTDDCPTWGFCDYEDGLCGTTDVAGICVTRPDGCPDLWDPVCGCDLETYGNACEANAVGVDVLSEGECEGPPPADVVCDAATTCPVDPEVGPALLCDYTPDSCGADGAEGVCVYGVLDCPDNYDPVCGCDGEDYPNACTAHSAGTDVAHAGVCDCTFPPPPPPPPTDILCDTAQPCPDTAQLGPPLFCDYTPDSCGLHDGAVGVCAQAPIACPDNYDPVCGCDGKDYPNLCDAHAAGVDIVNEGPCVCGLPWLPDQQP